MNRIEITIAIKQALEDIKKNLEGAIDIEVTMTPEENVLFAVRKENGRVQVYRIKVESV